MKQIKEYKLQCSMGLEPPSIWGFIRWTISPLIIYMLYMICHYRGHKYQNTGGHANGDTGSDYFTCQRCGDEIEHIYY